MFRCFVDIDGVLSEFVLGSCQRHGWDYSELIRDWPLGLWDFHNLRATTEDEFWAKLNDEDFWADLKPTPECFPLIEMVERRFGADNVCLLSSPSKKQPSSYAGKARWVEQHLPQYDRRLLVGACKKFCASPNSILIDDSDKNVEAFRAAGGLAILFPRRWNRNHDWMHNPLEYLEANLPG